jgi:hypothetical protein
LIICAPVRSYAARGAGWTAVFDKATLSFDGDKIVAVNERYWKGIDGK